jgi:hypothetical protein
MKKVYLSIIICLITSGIFLPWGLSGAENVVNEEPQVKVDNLRSEISLINLVNGLNLTEEQLNQLISILKEVQTLKESYKEKGRTIAAEAVAAISEYKQALIEKGPDYPPKLGEKAYNLNEQGKHLREKFEAELPPFQEKIEAVLIEAQKEVIATFKPCFLPPKSQRDPVRAGQAADYERAINILRKIRQIPQTVYEEKRKQTLERQFKKFEEKHGKLTDEEKAKEEKRLFSIVDAARAMDEDDFELNKEDLAKEFEIKDKREELSKVLSILTEYRNKNKPILNKTGRFFLNPKMLGVLEAKLTVLKNFKPLPAKKLD